MPEQSSKEAAAWQVLDAVQKVRRQKQRPTEERVRRALERDDVTSSDVAELLDLAVTGGLVERVYNPLGVVYYKELANASIPPSTVTLPKSSGDASQDTPKVEPSKPKPKKSDAPSKTVKETLRSELPKPISKQSVEFKKVGKKPLSRSPELSSVSVETVSADCKPVLVVDRRSDLSDVVLQVIVRLGSANGKALEKDIRGHYRLDVYPGVDIRRLIRAACKSLVKREQLRQEGNNFVLEGDDDDAADVTLTVDEPTRTASSAADIQVCAVC